MSATPTTPAPASWRWKLLGAATRALPHTLSGTVARAGWRMATSPGARPVRVHSGFTMRLDPAVAFHRAFALGYYDPGLTDELQRWIEPGTLLIDVGANVGFYTLMAASLAGPTGKVVAFEADPANVDALRDNIALNRYDHVEVVAAAAGAESGRARFVTGEHSVGSTLENAEGTIHEMGPEWVGAEKRVIDVEMVTLDARCADLVHGWPGRRVMKIDIEGAEPLGLRGATRMLEGLDAALVECNPPALEVHGFKPADITRVFLERGFRGEALPHGHGPRLPLPEQWTDWYNLLFTRPRRS